MARLTDKTLAQSTAITPTTLIHIVFTGDPSQNPDGSSFKAELQQLTSLFSGSTFTGGTVNSQTNFIGGLSANTFSATTIDLCSSNGTLYTSSISGCSPINMLSPVVFPQGISATTITINNNSISADTFVTGVTFNNSNYNLSLSRNDGVTLTSSLSILASDLRVTGGTYNSSTGTATFTNNSGGTFNVTGFLTGATDVRLTGGTYSNGIATFTNNTGGTFNVTGFYTGATDVFITGATYSNNNFTYTNSTGGSISVLFDSVSGLTSNGTISSQSITANTVSADTLTVSGITVNPKQLIALFFGHDSLSPGDTQTYYIGNSINLTAPISSSDGRRVIVPKTGNIIRVDICQTVGGAIATGSTEYSTFTINNVTQSTQSTITTTYLYNTSNGNIAYDLGTPLSVNVDDKIEIRWTTPAWGVNPTTIRQQMNVYLEY